MNKPYSQNKVDPNNPKGDSKDAIEFVKSYSPGYAIVLTAIIPDAGTVTETFLPKEIDKCEKWINKYQGKRNIHFTVNPANKPLTSKAKKVDIGALAWLHVDIDPIAGKNLTTERARILKLVKEYKPKPTLVIDSGGGYQAFWKLDAVVPVDKNIPELESYNKQLEIMFKADSCHNIDRVMRLPGTINIPNKAKIAKGRKEALAKLIWFNDVVYPLAAFSKAASVGPAPDTTVELGNVPDSVDLDELGISESLKGLIRTGVDPHKADKYKSRSEAVFAVATNLVRHGAKDDIIAAILKNRDFQISESCLEHKRPEYYISRQITRAKEAVIAPELAELNEKHAMIRAGGKVGVLTIPKTGDTDGHLEILSPTAFKDWYQNREIVVVRTNDRVITQKLGIWWLCHPNRKQFQGIIFTPNKEVPGYFNLWRGFEVEPKPGDCSIFLEHIKVNVAQGNQENFDFIMGWLADIFQNPASKCGTSLVIRGKQGTGKTKIGEVIGSLLGPHYLITSSSRFVTGRFNSHLGSCIVLHADEAFWAGDKAAEGIIKDLITGDTHLIEYKGKEPFSVKNYLRLFVTGNPEWMVPAGMEERRFAVFEIGEENIQDHNYFAAMDEEMENGGREALLDYLLNFDLSKVNLRKVPNTSELFNQKLNSLDSLQSWILTVLEEGALPGYADVDNACPTHIMFEDYIRHSKNIGINHRKIQTQVGIFLNKLFPNLKKIRGDCMDPEGPTSSKANYYLFPSLKECREAFEKQIGTEIKWDKEEDWGERIIDF